MKILVTGSNGFIGKNLICGLRNRHFTDIFEYDIDTDRRLLDKFTKECGFVFHLAGVNRPRAIEEFVSGNCTFTSELLQSLEKNGNLSTVLMSSSVQAALDNPYGKSKKAGEDLLFSHAEKTGANIYIYRLPNVFGKWCKPNYNSAVATFCSNIANDLPIQINDPNASINLAYIEDIVSEFINKIDENEQKSSGFCDVSPVYTKTTGEIAELIQSFKDGRANGNIPDMRDEFAKKLYSTYLSYLPAKDFRYPLKMNMDSRGSFTEFIKTVNMGQISVNRIKPGVTKGNHWHHTKSEKFLVVSGSGMITLRNIDSNEITRIPVSGEKLEVVDIPIGYAHSITNTGGTDIVTVIWANELFNPNYLDTFHMEV